ncbi:MAG: S-methyl-5-thioribose-1-phosphate isomerase [Dehalococcoidales bacterium]|nr:S-methyl-5-thioribose-1-phosphate isomerase [Dehalococcoidales bacterium]
MNRNKLDINYQPIAWLGNRVKILDQTRLPSQEAYLETSDYREVITAIKELKVRGAPAIGVAGAYALALGALKIEAKNTSAYLTKLRSIAKAVASARPTARNLSWAVERMEKVARKDKAIERIKSALVSKAVKIHTEEAEATVRLSRFGAVLIKNGSVILTHCNTGPLATTGYGTALGIIIYAHKQGKKVQVYADETRPLLQGARLTAWELKKANIPVTLLTDSMAGYMMKQGKIDCVIVGADRIAVNGDTANKIGTYSLAVLAKENKIPFYVAAPASTFDLSLKSGAEIPIEERNMKEVTHFRGIAVAPGDVSAVNPAFDITPARYITAFITEKGIIKRPFAKGFENIE